MKWLFIDKLIILKLVIWWEELVKIKLIVVFEWGVIWVGLVISCVRFIFFIELINFFFFDDKICKLKLFRRNILEFLKVSCLRYFIKRLVKFLLLGGW